MRTIQILSAGVAMALVVVAYGTFRCKTGFHDPLIGSILPPPFAGYSDGWALSHMVYFAVLAYTFDTPHEIALIWVMGVLWELLETVFRDRPFYLAECDKGVTVAGAGPWWYGRYEDIISNSIGIAVGVLLKRKYG